MEKEHIEILKIFSINEKTYTKISPKSSDTPNLVLSLLSKFPLDTWMSSNIKACLITFFENSFLFSRTKNRKTCLTTKKQKTIFCSQKQKMLCFKRTSFSCFHLYSDGCFKK